MRKVRDLLRLTRWQEYYGNVTFITLLGGYLVNASFFVIFLMLAANILSCAFAFMVNDIEDAQDDLLDEKKKLRNPVSSGDINNKSARLEALVIGIFALGLYSLFNKNVFLYGFAGIIIGFLYSYKKIRLKSIPVIDFLSHGYFLGLAYFLTVISSSVQLPRIENLLWLGIPIFFISVLGSLNNQIRDFCVDRKTSVKNTASVADLSKYKTLITYLLFGMFCLLLSFVYLYSSYLTKMLVTLVILTVGFYFFFIWIKKDKNIFFYPYSQTLFTLIGLLVFLEP